MKLCYLMGAVIDERRHLSVVSEMRMTLEQFLRFCRDPAYYTSILTRYGAEMCLRYPRFFEPETCIVELVEAESELHANYQEALRYVDQERIRELAIDLTDVSP